MRLPNYRCRRHRHHYRIDIENLFKIVYKLQLIKTIKNKPNSIKTYNNGNRVNINILINSSYG